VPALGPGEQITVSVKQLSGASVLEEADEKFRKNVDIVEVKKRIHAKKNVPVHWQKLISTANQKPLANEDTLDKDSELQLVITKSFKFIGDPPFGDFAKPGKLNCQCGDISSSGGSALTAFDVRLQDASPSGFEPFLGQGVLDFFLETIDWPTDEDGDFKMETDSHGHPSFSRKTFDFDHATYTAEVRPNFTQYEPDWRGRGPAGIVLNLQRNPKIRNRKSETRYFLVRVGNVDHDYQIEMSMASRRPFTGIRDDFYSYITLEKTGKVSVKNGWDDKPKECKSVEEPCQNSNADPEFNHSLQSVLNKWSEFFSDFHRVVEQDNHNKGSEKQDENMKIGDAGPDAEALASVGANGETALLDSIVALKERVVGLDVEDALLGEQKNVIGDAERSDAEARASVEADGETALLNSMVALKQRVVGLDVKDETQGD